MLKIRSMKLNAEAEKEALQSQNRVSDGMMFKLDWDPRIITLGDAATNEPLLSFIEDSWYNITELCQYLCYKLICDSSLMPFDPNPELHHDNERKHKLTPQEAEFLFPPIHSELFKKVPLNIVEFSGSMQKFVGFWIPDVRPA